MHTTLCSTCASIQDCSFVAVGKDIQLPKHVLDLKPYDQLEVDSCPGCQLFASVAELAPSAGTDPQPLSLWIHRLGTSIICGREGLVLVVASSGSRNNLDKVVETRGAISIIVADEEASAASLFVPARKVRVDRVDFESFRRRIKYCELNHKSCKAPKSGLPLPSYLRLINCKTLQIVPNASYRYTALSYVWGQGTRAPGREDGLAGDKPLTNLPKTIADAITATIGLGYGYIWIDRYCIRQDDEDDKMRQIDQMNSIYRHAEVTMFAIAGPDAHYGLPGVTTTFREHQPSFSVGEAVLTSIFKHPDHDIMSESVWGTRGWTYQEAYFSCQRLFFMKNQAYLECYWAGAAESVHPSGGRPHQPVYKKQEHYDRSPHEVYKHLTTYSGRNLTYDEDAIRAVAGVFNDYGYNSGPVPQLVGVPIVTSGIILWDRASKKSCLPAKRRVTDAFLTGLSWCNREIGRRRNVWPTRSWSWAEWDVEFTYGRIHQDDFLHTLRFGDLPQVQVEFNDGTCLDLEDMQALSILKDSKRLNGFIHIYSWILPLDLRPTALKRPPSSAKGIVSKSKAAKKKNQKIEKAKSSYDIKSSKKLFNVSMNFWPLDSMFGNEKRGLECGADPLGVILSKKYSEGGNWTFIMMVVQAKGSHYERIGICKLTRDSLSHLAKLDGLGQSSELGHETYQDPILNFCSKHMERRWLRIG